MACYDQYQILSQSNNPAYLSFARQFSEIGNGNEAGWNTDPPQGTQLKLRRGSEVIEEGMVVKENPVLCRRNKPSPRRLPSRNNSRHSRKEVFTSLWLFET